MANIEYNKLSYKNLIYNGWTINEILECYDISESMLLSFLNDFVNEEIIKNAILDYYKKNTIHTDKCIVLADSHIGGTIEDEKLLLKMLEYSWNNHIKNLVHLGDFIQGTTCALDIKKNFNYQLDQLEFYFKISNDNGYNLYYLFGNHEANLSKELFDILVNMIKKYPNIHFVGYQDSYIYLNDDDAITLDHYIPYPKSHIYTMPEIDNSLNLLGHSHMLQELSPSKIRIPALARVAGSIITDSGFAVLSNNDDHYELDVKGFESNYELYDRRLIKVPKKIKVDI